MIPYAVVAYRPASIGQQPGVPVAISSTGPVLAMLGLGLFSGLVGYRFITYAQKEKGLARTADYATGILGLAMGAWSAYSALSAASK